MIKIPFIKVSAKIFVLLALLFSLFPPFEHWYDKVKHYDFIFGGYTERRNILFGELIVEYILALLISIIFGYLIQRFIGYKSKKRDQKSLTTKIDTTFLKDYASKAVISQEKGDHTGYSINLTPEDLVVIGEKGITYIENGIRSFKDWTDKMIQELGEEIRPYLSEMYDYINVNYHKASEIEKLKIFRTNDTPKVKSIDQVTLKNYVITGVFHIENGITHFSEWSNVMIDEIGDQIRPYLEEIWEKIKQDYKKLLPDMNDTKILNEYNGCFLS